MNQKKSITEKRKRPMDKLAYFLPFICISGICYGPPVCDIYFV